MNTSQAVHRLHDFGQGNGQFLGGHTGIFSLFKSAHQLLQQICLLPTNCLCVDAVQESQAQYSMWHAGPVAGRKERFASAERPRSDSAHSEPLLFVTHRTVLEIDRFSAVDPKFALAADG